jgi:hypothetical protein
VPAALAADRTAPAPAAAVVDVLGEQPRRHAGLTQDHLHERVHRLGLPAGRTVRIARHVTRFGDKAEGRTYEE